MERSESKQAASCTPGSTRHIITLSSFPPESIRSRVPNPVAPRLSAALGLGDMRHGRDIQVRPWSIPGKCLQERRRRACPAVSSSGILERGDVAADLLGVFLVERHRPDPFPRLLGGGQQRVPQGLRGAPEARGVFAKRHHAGARKRRQVDDSARAAILASRKQSRPPAPSAPRRPY